MSGVFAPSPLSILGLPVTREAGPGLWRLLDELAERLGTSPVDAVVVGLSSGFFVTDGVSLLQLGDRATGGRTLYLSLPALPLLRPDETRAIIAHELAHFAGGDLDYSRRFLPIYAGVQRSLDAIVRAGVTRQGTLSLLTIPAVRLSLFVMDRFDGAVQHWSRMRELAADAASVRDGSADAAARALLRNRPVRTLTDAVLAQAFDAPATAPVDLVAAIAARATDGALSLPPVHQDEPTRPGDTHPIMRQRLAAFGVEGDTADLAEAVAPPPADALARLDQLFADPRRLSEQLTADLLALAQSEARTIDAELAAQVAAVGSEVVTLHENSAPRVRFLLVAAGVFLLVGCGFAVFPVSGIDPSFRWSIAAIAGAAGLCYLPLGWYMLRRGRAPFLILRPDAMTIAGLDRSIAWDEMAQIDVSTGPAPMKAIVEIAPGASLPERASGRRLGIDRKRRTITFTVPPPREMQRAEVPHLMRRYFEAREARRLIAERGPDRAAVGAHRTP